MGVIKQGILGGFSGKVGSVVGTSWKGVAVMKAMPLSVANPQTPLQQANRVRNSKALVFAQAVGTSFIRTYWNRIAKGMSGFNFFMSNNAYIYDGANLQWVLGNAVLAKGSIDGVELSSATLSQEGEGTVSWTDYGSKPSQSSTDIINVVLFNSDREAAFVSVDVPATEDNVTFNMPNGWTVGDTVRYWIVSRRANGTDFGSSAMLVGTITI